MSPCNTHTFLPKSAALIFWNLILKEKSSRGISMTASPDFIEPHPTGQHMIGANLNPDSNPIKEIQVSTLGGPKHPN